MSIECIEYAPRVPEFTSRAGVLPLGRCAGACGSIGHLRIDPLAFALRGDFYTYLCRDCASDRDMEA